MKNSEIESLGELEDFLKSNEKYKIEVTCERQSDDYFVRIEAYSETSNNEAMLMFKTVQSFAKFKIHIDSDKFTEAYNNLAATDKLPANYEILNPGADDNYMVNLIGSCYKEIMSLLKAFNHREDDYSKLVKLVYNKRTKVISRMHGL